MVAVRHIASAKRTIPGKSSELSVIIPAAGIGKRMKLKECPKSLVEIKDHKTLIEKQLHSIWHIYPKADIILSIGYGANLIRNALQDYPVRFVYNPIYETTGVAFSIGLGLQASISSKCLVVYGDLIFNDDCIQTITEGKSKILIDTNKCLNPDEVGLILDEHKLVSNFSFGLSTKWAQIAYLEGKELEIFKKACYKEEAYRWFGYEALNEIINSGGVLESHSVHSSMIFDIDTPQDLQKAKLTIN